MHLEVCAKRLTARGETSAHSLEEILAHDEREASSLGGQYKLHDLRPVGRQEHLT
jgi:hypothetical protein